jgi:acetylornithine deacetylase/succinyl-diaminopimelate desuccinylase-like protein
MVIEELHKKIDRSWDSHLRETREILKVPSVSFTGEGIEESARMMEDMLVELGAKTGMFRASGKSWPLVHGHLDVGAEKTCLLYGMYDVQPVGDLSELKTPLFAPSIVTHKRLGDILINRGVYNSKGSLAGALLAIRTMVDNNSMPVNIRFLIEGEEELGGLSLPKYVHKNKQTLSKADAAVSCDYMENADGVPVIALGMKGCVYFDLITDGKYQGGPESEIHSSDAVWVKSPVWRLTKALSTLVDDNQVPTVDGLWKNVVGPDKDDLQLIHILAKRFDIDLYKKDLGVKDFKVKGTKEELLKKYLFEPSLNICGLEAGYNGDGTKTVLPARAKAKIDIRLVPNMTIEDTREKVRKHLAKRGFSDIKIVHYVDYPLTKVSVREDVSQASIDAMRYHGKEPEVWPMVAGSAPLYLFNDFLGVPWGGVGLGRGGNAHAPNEYAVVKSMKDFEKCVVTMLWLFADMDSDRARAKKKNLRK